MLLLGRYCGSGEALCALVREGRRVPVYCDFEKEPSFAGCCRGIKAQAEESARHASVGFDKLCEELELAAMPVLTDDADHFHGFSPADESALGLFFDPEAGVLQA